MDMMSSLIGKTEGTGLVIDYGDFHSYEDSLIGIKKHKFVPKESLLELPGMIDLSYYVDFQNLSRSAKQTPNIITSFLNQRDFLLQMGIYERLESYSQGLDLEEREKERGSVERLLDPNDMGKEYKFLYVGCELIHPFNQLF